jgi:hypothetical protein
MRLVSILHPSRQTHMFPSSITAATSILELDQRASLTNRPVQNALVVMSPLQIHPALAWRPFGFHDRIIGSPSAKRNTS